MQRVCELIDWSRITDVIIQTYFYSKTVALYIDLTHCILQPHNPENCPEYLPITWLLMY